MMKKFRDTPPTTIAGSKVTYLKDYKTSVSKNLITGTSEKMNFPSSNVLQFITEDGTKISARPSGTEPKIKFYFSVKGVITKSSEFKSANDQLDQKIDTIIKDMGL